MAYTGKKLEPKLYDVYTKEEADATTSTLNTAIGTKVNTADIQNLVETYSPPTDLTPYSTTTQMNSAIASAVDDLNPSSITIPSYSTDPSSPSVGDIYHNSVEGVIKSWDGSQWLQMSNKFSADGGDAVYVYNDGTNDYRVHVFTNSGSFIPSAAGTIDVLMVAGGGGGGAHVPGGGGAGGLIWKQNHGVTPGSYTVTIGTGGNGSYNPGGYGGMPNASTGSNTTAFGMTAVGGGFAGSWSQDTRSNNGGSGGGRNGNYGSPGVGTQPSQSGDSGTYGYGHNGAKSNSPGNSPYGCGGGGGAGATPPNTPNINTSGVGGAGMDMSSYFGTSYGESGWFAGGGEGGSWGTTTLQQGGQGGGGDGDCPTNGGSGVSLRRGSGEPTGYNGATNTGGGGGGAGRTGGESSRGGNGGSGIVLVRYMI